jgi:hypothetical protein
MASIQIITAVKHRGALAHYEIRSEAPGIYFADLLNYEGRQDQKPPSGISLIRGITCWTGSIDDKMLLNALGLSLQQELDRKIKLIKEDKGKV